MFLGFLFQKNLNLGIFSDLVIKFLVKLVSLQTILLKCTVHLSLIDLHIKQNFVLEGSQNQKREAKNKSTQKEA